MRLSHTWPVEPLALGDVEHFAVDRDEDAAAGPAAVVLPQLLQGEVLLLQGGQRGLGGFGGCGGCMREKNECVCSLVTDGYDGAKEITFLSKSEGQKISFSRLHFKRNNGE